MKVARIHLHENYLWEAEQPSFDIAVLVLSETVAFDDDIRPICLPAADLVFERREATAAGWGRTSSTPNSPTSDHLMRVVLNIWSFSDCQAAVSLQYGAIFTENQICTGYVDGGRDTCNVSGNYQLLTITISQALCSVWFALYRVTLVVRWCTCCHLANGPWSVSRRGVAPIAAHPTNRAFTRK